ncbi:MAG TPA: FUSC family protein [Polyangiaceae bacterium]|nr:FUSC family protein [Polyangiaceae bacterium]
MVSAIEESLRKLRSSARLHAAVPDVATGVRAAVVMLGPFYLARVLARPELAWTALGGWLCTLADPGGARATRARALLAFASAGAVLVGVGEAVSGSAWTAGPALAVATFGLSMLKAEGGTAGRVGTLLAMAAAIACAGARTTPPRDAACFAAGALAAAVLSSVVWPVWTHLPVRRAVAAVYGELAAYASAAEATVAVGAPRGDPRWSAIVREHHRRIRGALEDARAIAVAVRARRIGETRLGSNVRALLGAAEAQFPLLATVVQEIEALSPDARASAAAALASVAANGRDVERVLVTRAISTRVAETTAPRAPGRPQPDAASPPVFARLGAMSHAAVDLAHSVDAPRPDVPAVTLLDADSARLRGALSLRSTFLRHALRASGAALAASLVGRAVAPHAYWVTLTALSVLQPYTGATIKRAAERVVGTVLGSAAAVVIMGAVRSPLVLATLLFPLSIAAVATRPRSYRLFTFFLTPVFVVLAERHFADWMTAAERAGDAVLGGAIALVAGVLVLPDTERERLPETLGRMLDVLAAYATRVLEGRAPGGSDRHAQETAVARRTMGIAFADAETSLERYLSEPGRDQAWSADAMLLVTYARRLATSLTSLDVLGVTPAIDGRAVDQGTVAAYVRRVLESAKARVRGDARASATPPAGFPELPAPADTPLRRVLEWTALIADLGAGAAEGG